MRKIIIYSATVMILAACSNAIDNDKKKTGGEPGSKEEPGTSISISPDSIGIKTKKGDKIEISKDSLSIQNKD